MWNDMTQLRFDTFILNEYIDSANISSACANTDITEAVE